MLRERERVKMKLHAGKGLRVVLISPKCASDKSKIVQSDCTIRERGRMRSESELTAIWYVRRDYPLSLCHFYYGRVIIVHLILLYVGC